MDARELERLGLLVGLDAEQRAEAFAALKLYEFGAGERLLEEGEPDRCMLIVLEGELEVTLGGVSLGGIGRGELVGEMTLFGSFDRRSATVASRTPSRVLLLDEEALRFLRLAENPLARTLETQALRTIATRLRETDQRIAAQAQGEPASSTGPQRGLLGRLASALVGGEMPRTPAPRVLDVLRATHGFAGRDEAILQSVAARMQVVSVGAGDVLVSQGRAAEDAFIVAEGKVGVYCGVGPERYERVATLGPGHIFGVVALADAKARTATCRAMEPCHLVRITAGVYRELETENTPEGRAFRRGIIDALSMQLRLANEHLLTLAGRAGR